MQTCRKELNVDMVDDGQELDSGRHGLQGHSIFFSKFLCRIYLLPL